MSLTDNFIIDKFGFLLRSLPDSFIFGDSYTSAQKISAAYQSTRDRKDFICSYQEKKLKEIFTVAVQNTDFYRQKFNIGSSLSIDVFPLIDKKTMQLQLESFVANKSKCDYVTTGGTSGTPFGFYIDKSRKGREWFFITDLWSRVGFDVKKSHRAVLRNHSLPQNKLVRHNSFLREYIFSNFNLDDNYMAVIVRYLKEFEIEFIHAYPSAAYHLCTYLKSRNIKLPVLKAFLCSSENVLDHQRELIEKELNIRMFSFYGHSEKLVLAGECEYSGYYHADPFYGFMELIDDHGTHITVPGQVGEIVGTGFANTVMPFIRYKTGDSAEFVGDQCPHCGRQGIIIKNVVGRWQGEKVFSTTGSFITTTALNMHSDVYENITDFQYYQKYFGKLTVKVVAGKFFSDKDIIRIKSTLSSKLGPDFDVSVQCVDEIEYTKNRKYKLLVQEIQA